MTTLLKAVLDSPNRWFGLAVTATFFLFSSVFLLQISPALIVLSMVPLLLSPFFLILTSWRYGSPMGWAAAGATSLLVAFLFNIPILLFFLLQVAMVGTLLGEGLRRRFPLVSLLFVVPLIVTLLSLAMGAVYYTQSGTAIVEFAQSGSEALRLAVEENARKFQLGPDELIRYQKAVENLMAFLKVAFPALIFINTFSIASLNLAIALGLANRFQLDRSHVPPLSLLSIPSNWIWGLIVSGFIYLLNVPYLKWVGLNVALFFLTGYLVQGYGILAFYLKRTRLPGVLIGMTYLLFLLHPLLIALLCILGHLETWFNFRQRAAS